MTCLYVSWWCVRMYIMMRRWWCQRHDVVDVWMCERVNVRMWTCECECECVNVNVWMWMCECASASMYWWKVLYEAIMTSSTCECVNVSLWMFETVRMSWRTVQRMCVDITNVLTDVHVIVDVMITPTMLHICVRHVISWYVVDVMMFNCRMPCIRHDLVDT